MPKQAVKIEIGSQVVVRLNTGRIVRVTITTPAKINPDEGLISLNSPLGKSLLGKCEGNICRYFIGNKELRAKVMKVL